MEHAAHLPDAIAFGIAMCHTAAVEHGTLLTSLFVVGLLGSVSHCVGMCGPFVLGQVVARLEATPAARLHEFRRLTGAALAPCHLGRITTYGLLGAGAGAIAGGVGDLTGLRSRHDPRARRRRSCRARHRQSLAVRHGAGHAGAAGAERGPARLHGMADGRLMRVETPGNED